ncbi:MAG TPA: transposase [Xanthomonadaceae bacterium]|nr:transposase [Xanthomonadaceae bacterium]
MPKKPHPSYPTEFRHKIIALVRAGRTPEELSREFEPSAQTIRNWVAQDDRDSGPHQVQSEIGQPAPRRHWLRRHPARHRP